MTRHASLPMYNLPEMQADNTAFWQAIRTEAAKLGVGDLPAMLDFERKPVPDRIDADAVFTQVCGWPLQTIYAGQAAVLGVPVYAVAHCDGPTHAGVFVVRRNASFRSVVDLRGCAFVYNSVHSNSGMNLPRRVIAELAGGEVFFGSITETHSQPANLERVARGEADATCVDCVTYAFFARYRPALADRLRVLDATPSTPAIPFVTAAETDAATREALVEALHRVATAPEWGAVRTGMMLSDISAAAEVDYQVPCRYAAEADVLGYPVLR
jgi:ABC-type phosphate/phosphonate transport system substrate-binding protein